jgi:hypothetical protein
MTAKVNESDRTLVESLSGSLRKWMPRCEFCDCFATRQQTWSDRGPLYFCCSETCATKARACYDEDHEYDQYGLEIYPVKWKETAMILQLLEDNLFAQNDRQDEFPRMTGYTGEIKR